MEVVRKVCAAVVRPAASGLELLVFEHPSAGVQLPKGGLEPGEEPRKGVLRELLEETGVSEVRESQLIGTWERATGAGPMESGPVERHVWDVFLLRAPDGLDDEWTHHAWGSAAECGLQFRCHWLPLDTKTHERLHPLYASVVRMVLDAVRT